MRGVYDKQLADSLPLVDRGIKQAGFYVLAQTDCPATIVETAFIDNPADAQLLVECEDVIDNPCRR